MNALVQMADALYLNGRFDEALSLLDELASKDVESNAVQAPMFNDGLKLRLLLNEHAQKSPEPLRYLAKGDWLTRRRLYDLAIGTLDSLITGWPQHTLAANALFKKGEILLFKGEYSRCLKNFDTLIARFPYHLLSDQALERSGWAYEKMGNPKEALSRYEILLVSYPQSFQIDDIRRRIRRIEKEKK